MASGAAPGAAARPESELSVPGSEARVGGKISV